jgi:hypothetical protein
MPFDSEQSIPTFGFGDFVSQASGLVSFEHSGAPLKGIDEVVTAYDQVLRKAHLSGPANWAPAILKAIQLVDASGGRFHVLVILTVSSVRFFVLLGSFKHLVTVVLHTSDWGKTIDKVDSACLASASFL